MTSTLQDAGRRTLIEFPRVEAALEQLCRPFAGDDFNPVCSVVQPDAIPHPQDSLLVHHEHMTAVLERFHRRPMTVQVLDERLERDQYTRKISLKPQGVDKVVEWGVVRLDFRYMDPAVRDEILAKQSPLGAVLIKHDVLRRIKPRWFLQFPPGGPVLDLFGAKETQPLYGRIGTIYCNDEPAIELLELVAGLDADEVK